VYDMAFRLSRAGGARSAGAGHGRAGADADGPAPDLVRRAGISDDERPRRRGGPQGRGAAPRARSAAVRHACWVSLRSRGACLADTTLGS